MGREAHAGRGTSRRSMRMAVDAALACLLLVQMMHLHIPDAVHEVCGILVGVCLVLHVVQHRRWFAGLARGSWDVRRVVSALVVAAMLACLVAMLASGLAMSSWAAQGGAHGAGVARAVHLPLVHAGFCLMALHAGMQMHAVLPSLHVQAARGPVARMALVVASVAVAAFGVWSLVDLRFADYILGTVGFALIDPSRPVLLDLAEYLAVSALFAGAGNMLSGLLAHQGGGQTRG